MRDQQPDSPESKITPETEGRYEPIGEGERGGELGRGGIGRILLALDHHLGREVAIKELLPREVEASTKDSGPTTKRSDEATRASTRARFLREARVTGQLEHPNIVPVYELGQRKDGTLYYTMKVVRGKTLKEAIECCKDAKERLRLLPHVVDLCHAIAYAHSRGVIHRDIKPQNVMVGQFGQTVVLDWGVAKVRGEADTQGGEAMRRARSAQGGLTTVAGTQIGTPAYMSPEQAAGEIDAVDERSDVWGLGAVLLTILTGGPNPPPLSASNAGTLGGSTSAATVTVKGAGEQEELFDAPIQIPDAPAELVAICNRAMRWKRTDRYDSAAELAEDVAAYLAGSRVSVYEYTTWEIVRRSALRHWRLLAVIATSALVLAVMLLTAHLRVRDERDTSRRAEKAAQRATRGERLRHAESLREGARAALASHNPLEARAKLRMALELQDHIEARVLAWRLSKEPMIAARHLGTVIYALAFSPDGRHLAVAGIDHAIYLLDAETSTLLRVLRGHGDQVTAVAYSRDGRWLASGDWGGRARLWSMPEGRSAAAWRAHDGALMALDFSPDGQSIGTGGAHGQVRLWRWSEDAKPKKVRKARELKGHESTVRALAFAPDGKLLASGGDDRTLRLFSLDEGRAKSLSPLPAAIKSLAFSPGGEALACGAGATIHLYSSPDAKLRQKLEGHRGTVWTLDFSPDGKRLLSGGFDRDLRIWSASNGKLLGVLSGHTAAIRGARFDRSGRRVASGGNDRSVRLWHSGRARLDETTTPPRAGMNGVAFFPDGEKIVTAGNDNRLLIWETKSGKLLRELTGHEAVIYGVAVSPDGSRVASASNDRTVRIWDLASGRSQVLRGHTSTVYGVAFSPDGRQLLSGGTGGVARLWEVKSGKLLRRLVQQGKTIVGLTISPDGRHAATARADKKVEVWDLKTGRSRAQLEGHTSLVWGVRFTGRGELVASGQDGSIWRWDWRNKRGAALRRVAGRAYWMDLDAKAERIVTAHSDGVARLTSIEGKALGELRGHRSELCAAAFSPDGELVATTSDDATLRLWRANDATPYWRGLLLSHPPRLLSHRGWTRFHKSSSEAPSPRWQRALSQASLAKENERWGCLTRKNSSLELWDRRRDERVAAAKLKEVRGLSIRPEGCVVLAGDRVLRLDKDAKLLPLVSHEARAMSAQGKTIWVATNDKALELSVEGRQLRAIPIPHGVKAILPRDEQLVLGFAEGMVELIDLGGAATKAQAGIFLADVPSSEVVSIARGRKGAVFVGFANGALGMWSLESGRRLFRARLHGSLSQLLVGDGRLIAATELGDHRVFELEAIGTPYCRLMRRLWRDVPIGWRRGKALRRPPPRGHACEKRKGSP